MTTGEEDLRGGFTGPAVSEFVRPVTATPGRDLPAETGRSGSVVLKLGGTSRGKSGSTIGCGEARVRGAGELALDAGAELRPFAGWTRPTDDERPVAGAKAGVEFRRVGVDGREFDRVAVEFKFAGICGRAVGVEGRGFWDGLILLSLEELVDGRVLEGVDDLDGTARAAGADDLAADVKDERVVGVEGLDDVTEAELVLRTDVRLEECVEYVLEMDGRVTELLLVSLVEWLFSE